MRRDIHILVEALTRDLFSGTPAFQLAGAEGHGRLLSALGQPRWPQHRTAQQKAAALHYSLNKNHPYVDGNKRLAITAMEWFLWQNNIAVFASNNELVDFPLRVASNELSREGSTRWVKARSVRFSWNEDQFLRWFKSLSAEEAVPVRTAIERNDPGVFGQTVTDTTQALLREARKALADLERQATLRSP